jgi:chemotaxis protein methyltransferase CheR
MTLTEEEFHFLIRSGLEADRRRTTPQGGPAPGPAGTDRWFRDPAVWDVLRTSVLPELVRTRDAQRQLSLWSAACATGPEAYSLALLLTEHFPALARWTVRLVGSDRDERALEQAEHGCYAEHELQGLTGPGLRSRHFVPVGPLWRAGPELRGGVDFKRIELTGMWPSLPVFDVVLLRNALVHHEVPVRRRILDRLHRVTAPDGYLVIGAVENLVGVTDRWQPEVREGVVVFRPVSA